MPRLPRPITLLLLAVFAFLEAAPALAARTGNCEITVTQVNRSGRPKKRVFRSNVETKEECAEKAEHHKLNFAPTRVKSKKVKYRFKKLVTLPGNQ